MEERNNLCLCCETDVRRAFPVHKLQRHGMLKSGAKASSRDCDTLIQVADKPLPAHDLPTNNSVLAQVCQRTAVLQPEVTFPPSLRHQAVAVKTNTHATRDQRPHHSKHQSVMRMQPDPGLRPRFAHTKLQKPP